MGLIIELTDHYSVIREDGYWQVIDKKTGKPASASKHEGMPAAVTEANGLEVLRP